MSKEVKETKKESHSDAYNKYAKLIEAYKKQNPVKFAAKKDILEARLAALE